MKKVDNKSNKYYVYNIVDKRLLLVLESKDELIKWFAKSQGLDITYRHKFYNNTYLDNLNMTFEDTYLHSEYDYIQGYIYNYMIRPYAVIDGYNRIIDVRTYYKEILVEAQKIANKSSNRFRGTWYIRSMQKYVGKGYKGALFRKEPIPYISNNYNAKFYRRVKTTNELRQNAAPEIKEYVRPSRKKPNLPDSWDEVSRHLDNCWKSQRKCRKQWMKNL